MKSNRQTLERQLPTTTDIARVDTLNELSWEFRTEDTQRSYQLAEEAYGLAIKFEYDEGIAYSLANMGRAEHYFGENLQAVNHSVVAVAIAEAIKKVGKFYFHALSTYSMIQMSLDNHHEVLETSLKLLDATRDDPDFQEYQLVALNGIGSCYSHTGEYEKALEAYAKALPIAEQISDFMMMGVCCLNQTTEYIALERFEESLIAVKNGLMVLEQAHYADLVVAARTKMGEVYYHMQDDAAAIRHLEQALKEARALKVHQDKRVIHALFQLGIVNLRRGDLDVAEAQFLEGLSLAQETHQQALTYNCHEKLAALYEQRQDFEHAYHHYREFHRVKEIAFNEQNAQRMNLLKVQYQTEQAHRTAHYYREQHALQEQLLYQERRYFEEMHRLKDELIQTTSHDLKNPLTIIQTRLHLLRHKPPPHDKHLDTIELQIKRMQQLLSEMLDDMLDVARLETHMQKMDLYDEVVLDTLLQETIQEFLPVAGAKQIVVDYENAQPLLALPLSQDMMQRVFANLLSNAIKYTPEQRQIWIRVTAQADRLCIQFEDAGIGIDEEDLPLIFEKFFRAKSHGSLGIEGTGLGLYIVKRILEAHRGTITVKSMPNVGSTFEVRLPLVQ